MSTYKERTTPTGPQIDNLIARSEKFNNSKNHLHIMLNINSMSRNDVSYHIEKLTARSYKDDHGNIIYNSPVSTSTYFKNKEISKDPLKFKENLNPENSRKKTSDRENLYHVKRFTKAMKDQDYSTASIHYLSLPLDHEVVKRMEDYFKQGKHVKFKEFMDKY